MIIKLHNDIEKELSSIEDPINELALAINKLFELMLERKHVIVASQMLLTKINKLSILNPYNKKLIQQLLDHHTNFYGSLPKTNKILYVVPNKSYFKNDTNVEYITLNACQNLSQSILSTENPSDFCFYDNLFKFMNTNVSYTASFYNGSFGGGTAKQFLDSMVSTENIILAICDSDKDYNTCKLGDTATIVKRYVDRYNSGKAYLDYYILSVREKENLIPIEWYKLFCEKEKKPLIESVYAFSDNTEFMKFVDLKAGIKVKQIKNPCKQWHGLYDDFIDLCKTNGAFNSSAYRDDDYCIKGIGGRKADRLSEIFFCEKNEYNEKEKNILSESNFDTMQHIPEYIMNIYFELYNLMFTYGCAPRNIHNSFLYR